MACYAAFCKKPSVIKGIHRLQHKESHRGQAIAEEFGKAGIRVELDVESDEMKVHPGAIESCTFDARGDHRMAMAGAVLGLAGAPIEIVGAEAVDKSYPGFFDDLSKVGARFGRA